MTAPTAPLASGAGGINLNPSLLDLLAFNPDWPMLAAILATAAAYAVGYFRSPRAARSQEWPLWKVISFALGLILWFLATQSRSSAMTGQSMALYMARLMVLAEMVPPLLLLGLPRMQLAPRSLLGRVLGVLLDPWVAFAVWTAVIIFWNIPAGFNASVVTNSAAQLLPWLYLLSSAMVWGVVLRPVPSVQPVNIGSRGWFGLLSALPMMAVASVWLYSPKVLYTPYANALCLWNLSPLQNQQWSGWIMMIAGLPGMALAFVQLLMWLIKLADGGYEGVPTESVDK